MAYRLLLSSSSSVVGRSLILSSISSKLSSKLSSNLPRHYRNLQIPVLQGSSLPSRFFSSSSSSLLDVNAATSAVENVLDPLALSPSPFEDLFTDESLWFNPYQSLITSEEIRARQRNLLRLTSNWLRVSHKSSISVKQSPLILIASNPPQYQAHTNIPVDNCKQNTDFTYFTGLHSGESDQLTSDCVLALYADNPEAPEPWELLRSVLFAPTRTKSEQLWNGPDLANSGYSGNGNGFLSEVTTDGVRPLAELVEFVNSLVKRPSRRDVFLSKNGLQYRPELVTHLKYYMIGSSGPKSSDKDTKLSDWAERWSTAMAGTVPSVNVRDVSSFVDQLRAVKSPAEARALRRIGRIGARALKRTIEWSRDHVQFERPLPPFYESHIGAKFEFESRITGGRRIAFPSVCASGRRATIIHYGRNDRAVKPEDWILTDVGAEDPDGYCCDISRSWPISLAAGGQESFQLRLHLYEALVGVQRRLMGSIRVRDTSLDDLYRVMQSELTQVLVDFNAFDESVVTNGSNLASLTRRICPHHVSHYIGLDIHDTPTTSRSKALQPGNCFSIEPGLYFPVHAALPIRAEFRGIGLRVEDDLLIDPETHSLINLTADCPSL